MQLKELMTHDPGWPSVYKVPRKQYAAYSYAYHGDVPFLPCRRQGAFSKKNGQDAYAQPCPEDKYYPVKPFMRIFLVGMYGYPVYEGMIPVGHYCCRNDDIQNDKQLLHHNDEPSVSDRFHVQGRHKHAYGYRSQRDRISVPQVFIDIDIIRKIGVFTHPKEEKKHHEQTCCKDTMPDPVINDPPPYAYCPDKDHRNISKCR